MQITQYLHSGQKLPERKRANRCLLNIIPSGIKESLCAKIIQRFTTTDTAIKSCAHALGVNSGINRDVLFGGDDACWNRSSQVCMYGTVVLCLRLSHTGGFRRDLAAVLGCPYMCLLRGLVLLSWNRKYFVLSCLHSPYIVTTPRVRFLFIKHDNCFARIFFELMPWIISWIIRLQQPSQKIITTAAMNTKQPHELSLGF